MGTAFVGTYVNKVDLKGRVSIPAPFRLALADQPYNGIVVMPSFKLPALEGSGIDRMTAMMERLDTYEEFSPEYIARQALFGEAVQVPFDSEGRVILPRALLEEANITETIQFVGAARIFQMWEPSAYNEHKMLMRSHNAKHTTLPPLQGGGRS